MLDYRHCSLDFLPSDVFVYERTLEELFLDANQIKDLPRVRICSEDSVILEIISTVLFSPQ